MWKYFTIASCTICSLFAQEVLEKDRELSIGIPSIPQLPNEINIRQSKGIMEFHSPSQQLRYLGDFQLRSDTGLEMHSRNAIFDMNTGLATLDGNVSIYQSGLFQRGDKAVYDFQQQKLTTSGLRISVDPIFLESGQFTMAEDKHGETFFIGKNARITTHDVEHPNFWIKADEIRVYPDDSVTFDNLKLYAGGVPVFWLPYLSQPLDPELGYHFIPGAKTTWGAYLLNSYGMMIENEDGSFLNDDEGKPWLLAQYLVDIRTRRGIGLGTQLKDIRLKHNPNLTGLSLYYTNDLDPQFSRNGIVRDPINEDRYQIEFKHRQILKQGDWGITRLDSNLTWTSDQYYREDFQPKLYKIDPDPDNQISLLHQHPRFLAGLTQRLRLNDFYDTTTSSPEIFLDIIKGPIFDSPILYEGSFEIGKFKEHIGSLKVSELESERNSLALGDPRIAEIDQLLDKRGYNRFHTWHEFALPLKPREGVSIVPNAGFGYTNYWGISNGSSGFDRTHVQAGVDFSLKFARTYDAIRSSKWGLDGLLHTFQPYANFSYLATDALDPSFGKIDRLTPSTEGRPIRVGRFSAIDSLNDWSIIRLGMRNNLLTRRDEGSHAWLTLDSYIDVFLEDPELDREFSNLYNQLAWHPLPWFKLNLDTQFPLAQNGSGFSEYSTSMSFMPSRNTEVSVGYRYLNSHPTLEDSSQVDIRAYTRFNEQWGLSFYQKWELDDGTLETQQYALHRDLGSWDASVGIHHRNNRIIDEFSLMLSFTLKELPSISLPISLDTE